MGMKVIVVVMTIIKVLVTVIMVVAAMVVTVTVPVETVTVLEAVMVREMWFFVIELSMRNRVDLMEILESSMES